MTTNGERKTNRFYNSSGRETKLTGKEWVENGQGCSWVDELSVYYIRSSVLGGEMVSEADASGRKTKTFVRAAGATLARQNIGGYDTNGNAILQRIEFEQWDASGMSFRQTLANAVGTYNGAEQAGEADPLGNGMGLDGVDYVQANLPLERDYPLVRWSNETGHFSHRRI